jgi:hypothetical protein
MVTAVLLGLALLTSSLAAVIPIGDLTPFEIGERMGSAALENVAPVLVCVLFGWLAFLIARRSNRIGNIVTGLFACVQLFAALVLIVVSLVATTVTPEGGTTVDPGSTIQRVAASHQVELEDTVARQREAATKFIEAGGIDPATMKSKEELTVRRRDAAEARVQTEKCETFLRGYLDMFERDLLAAGLAEENVAQAVLGARSSFPERELVGRMAATAETLTLADQILEIHERHWGEWEFDPETSLVNFGDAVPDETVASYNELVESMGKAADREEEFSKRLAEIYGREPDGD